MANAVNDGLGTFDLFIHAMAGLGQCSRVERRAVEPAQQTVCVIADGGQWLGQLVDQRRRHFAEGRQAGGMLQLFTLGLCILLGLFALDDGLAQFCRAALHLAFDPQAVQSPQQQQQGQSEQDRPVAQREASRRGLAQIEIGADFEFLHQGRHRAVVGGNAPAITVDRRRCRQQLDGQPARCFWRGRPQGGDRPVRVQAGRMPA